jgi:hypothetical protein
LIIDFHTHYYAGQDGDQKLDNLALIVYILSNSAQFRENYHCSGPKRMVYAVTAWSGRSKSNLPAVYWVFVGMDPLRHTANFSHIMGT